MASGNPILNGIRTDTQKRSQQPRYGQYAPEQPGNIQYGNGQYGAGPQGGAPAPGSPEQLEHWYQAPAAGAEQTQRATREDVVMKTLIMLGVVVALGAVGWTVPVLAFPGMVIGLVLGLVNVFKKKVSPALVLLYAAAEGLFLGGVSSLFEARFPGIVVMAVVATLVVFFGMLGLYARAGLRIGRKLGAILGIAMLAYLVFILGDVVLGIFTGTSMRDVTIPGTSIPFGVVIGLLAVVMASLCLVSDFQNTEAALEAGVPEKESWRLAFGLVVTLVWLYVEILRLISYFMPRD